MWENSNDAGVSNLLPTMSRDIELLNEEPVLRLTGIYKSFEDNQVLAGIGFEILEGEILALLGPSGCGKSTLLAIIAGIESPDHGQIPSPQRVWFNVPGLCALSSYECI
jgi:ABC-type glutathione transport system ATPase component